MASSLDETDGIPKIDYGGLENSTGFLITVAQVEVFRNVESALSPFDLSPGAASALILIGRNPGIQHGTLANALDIKLARMTKLIKSFEKRGLVRRHNPVRDRRIVELTLTDAGRRLTRQVTPSLLERDAENTGNFRETERAEFNRLLKKYSRFGRPTE